MISVEHSLADRLTVTDKGRYQTQHRIDEERSASVAFKAARR